MSNFTFQQLLASQGQSRKALEITLRQTYDRINSQDLEESNEELLTPSMVRMIMQHELAQLHLAPNEDQIQEEDIEQEEDYSSRLCRKPSLIMSVNKRSTPH